MAPLFQRPDGTPMQFYLVNLPEESLKKYKHLIEINGGKVEKEPNEKILLFTLPSYSYDISFIFDVKFIDDSVEYEEILNIDRYFIGDSRVYKGCKISRGYTRNHTTCLGLTYIRNKRNESIDTLETLAPGALIRKRSYLKSGYSSRPRRKAFENSLLRLSEYSKTVTSAASDDQEDQEYSDFSESEISDSDFELCSSDSDFELYASDSESNSTVSEP